MSISRTRLISSGRLISELQENPHFLKRWSSRSFSCPLSFHDPLDSLLYACWVGDIGAAQHILSHIGNILEMEDLIQFSAAEFEITCLHLAVWNMHEDVVDRILEHSVTVFARSPIGKFTALHLAVFNNDVKMVTKLLTAGALVSIMDVNGETSLDWAVRYTTNENLIKTLVEVASFERTWNVNALKSTVQLAIHVENTKALNILLQLLAGLHPSWKWWDDILRKRGIEESPEKSIRRLRFISNTCENLSIQDSSGCTFGECMGMLCYIVPPPATY